MIVLREDIIKRQREIEHERRIKNLQSFDWWITQFEDDGLGGFSFFLIFISLIIGLGLSIVFGVHWFIHSYLG